MGGRKDVERRWEEGGDGMRKEGSGEEMGVERP